MNFFLDIFNRLLKVNENNILIIFDLDGEIWFALRDVYKVLGYNNINKVINYTIINTGNKEYYVNLSQCPRGHCLTNMHPNQVFVNEAGLYEVLLKSTKPLAELFTYKLLTDIMPEIRKKGKYILKKSEKKKLDKLNNKIDNYQQELTYYYNKYKFEVSKDGYFYINENKVINNGKNITCYKIG
jgi:prophage antirepressor-like protein